MNEFPIKIKEILKSFFPETSCGIYLTFDKKRYFLFADTREDMPHFIYKDNMEEEYFYENVNDDFILIFKEKIKEEIIKEKLSLLKEYIENGNLKYYFEKLKKNFEEIRIPYISVKALGEILRNFYPDTKLFLWLKEKYESFYFFVYSYPVLDNKFFYLTFIEDKILDIESIKDYHIKKFFEEKNIKYVKILKDKENVIMWGFKSFPIYDKIIDEMVKNFLPSKFLFLDIFEIFVQEIYKKDYKDFKKFAFDFLKKAEEIGESISLYLKICFPFLKEEFCLSKNALLEFPKEAPPNLNKVETKFGEIYYYLDTKNFHPFFKNIFEQKLKEISTNIFNEIIFENLKSFSILIKDKGKIKENEIEEILVNFKKFSPFTEDILNLLLNYKELVVSNNICRENLERYEKMNEMLGDISVLILKEKDVRRIFDSISKMIKDIYLEIEEIVWIELIEGKINRFFSSSRFLTPANFEEILYKKENKFNWKYYTILKESVGFDSYRCDLYFLVKKIRENIFYSLVMRKFNILLCFLINYKEQKEKCDQILIFERDLPIKIKTLKNIFSLPFKFEEILTCKREKLDIKELICDAIERSKSSVIKKNINIEFLKKDVIFINGYKPLLDFAFYSLFDILLKGNRIGGKMELEINKDKNFIYISDTGIGLSKSQVENIKEPSPEKEDFFSTIGSIFKIHGFEIVIEVEKGLGNKIKIFL